MFIMIIIGKENKNTFFGLLEVTTGNVNIFRMEVLETK